MTAREFCKQVNLAVDNHDDWTKLISFVPGSTEAEYRGWKVKVCFTNKTEVCYIFPLSKLNKQVKMRRPEICFVPRADLCFTSHEDVHTHP